MTYNLPADSNSALAFSLTKEISSWHYLHDHYLLFEMKYFTPVTPVTALTLSPSDIRLPLTFQEGKKYTNKLSQESLRTSQIYQPRHYNSFKLWSANWSGKKIKNPNSCFHYIQIHYISGENFIWYIKLTFGSLCAI